MNALDEAAVRRILVSPGPRAAADMPAVTRGGLSHRGRPGARSRTRPITVTGGNTIAVSGDLDAGQASCTASVPVRLTRAGIFRNDASNVNDLVGIDPPGASKVTSTDLPSFDCPDTDLAPGASVTCTGDDPYVVSVDGHRAGEVVNVATATAQGPAATGGAEVRSESTVVITSLRGSGLAVTGVARRRVTRSWPRSAPRRDRGPSGVGLHRELTGLS